MRQGREAFQIDALRSKGCFLPEAGLCLVRVGGAEAGQLLQARSTNDVLSLAEGDGQRNLFLDRSGHLLADFMLYRLDGGYSILASSAQAARIVEQIEFYVFRQDVTLEDVTGSGSFFLIAGPQARSFARSLFDQTGPQFPAAAQPTINGQPVLAFKTEAGGEHACVLFVAGAKGGGLAEFIAREALAAGFAPIAPADLERARIEAGVPSYGVDMREDDLVTDTGLQNVAVSYTKGCYVGQEVVARLKAYGAPRRGLVGLIFAEGLEPELEFDAQLSVGGEAAGRLKSFAWCPARNCMVAMASLARDFRTADRTLALAIGGTPYTVTVKTLPLYEPQDERDRARALYEEALADFAAGRQEDAKTHLRQALELDPGLADAYEVLGVILSREGQLDEAIQLMTKLAELDPQSIMAHTNLSVFFMQAGDKEKAEEEKAISMSLRMLQAARQADARQAEENDRAARLAEARERMDLYRQVLDIDADDLLANYGLGSIHVELCEHEQALPYLIRALSVKPSHTVAYLALGTAYEGLGRIEQALATYEDGIAMASARGDLTPLKEMQARSARLRAGAPASPPEPVKLE